MNAAGLARRLGAQRQGQNWRCDCPLGCGYTLSLKDGVDGKLLAHCFGGHEYDEIALALVEFGLLDDDDADADLVHFVAHGSKHYHTVDDDEHDARRIAHALQLYKRALWDERLPIYLLSRGINLTSPVLRFLEQAPHRLGARLPAILAPVVDVNGEQTGVHMTFLKHDGSAKAALPKQYQRECRGVVRGGVIRLAEHDPDYPLIIGEGVETTLSAMQIFGRLGWSAVYAGGLKTVTLPASIRSVIIAADHDTSGIGQLNALAARSRWMAEGRAVRIVMPPEIGTDFNDVLRARS